MLNRIKHPNVVLLMGVVQKPPNLSIVTEFVPYGNLYQLLHVSKRELSFQDKVPY